MAVELSASELNLYVELEQHRRDHQRQADALERQVKAIKERLLDYVRRTGGSDRTTTRHKFVLAIRNATGQINWKKEFVDRLGQAAADAIPIPTREQLVVEPVVKG